MKQCVEKELETDDKPPSAPPIPSDVPRGRKYMSRVADWEHASWKRACFSMRVPQYHRVRFDTAKNGKSSTIVVEGDVDGDGVIAKYTVAVRLNDKGVVEVGPVKVENERE